MQFEPTPDQQLMSDAFRRFLDANSSMERVRAALPLGFDAELWTGLGDLGALALRVPEEKGGLGLGLFDAVLLMEEAGRVLASGPLAETIVVLRLLGQLDADDVLIDAAGAGRTVVGLAHQDVAEMAEQLVAGGAVARFVLARDGDAVVLVPVKPREPERTLASTPIARLSLDGPERVVLARGPDALAAFEAGLEEWKLLMAAALVGLSGEAIRLAARYATERSQFGRLIGAYQAISHPLASLNVDVDAGRFLIWRAIRDLADGRPLSAAAISGAAWWACDLAGRAVAQALHTFGGYGLTLEYDIHLFNLRAKAWPLIAGDPDNFLTEAAERRYGGQRPSLPQPGDMPIEFSVGEEAHALAEETRAFFDRTLTPELRARAHYSFSGHVPEVHRALADARLLFPLWPERLGGRSASPYAEDAALRVWEENNWTTNFQGTTLMVGTMIDRFGSDEVKRDVLSRIVTGEVVCSLGFSEPGSGSDVFSAITKAVPDGDGWRIDGQKMFTSGADMADYVMVLTRTDPDAPKHAGLTMFLVPLAADGVTVHPVHTFQEERTNVTYYDAVKVSDAYRVGDVGGGIKVMQASLEQEHGLSFAPVHLLMVEAAERLCGAADAGERPRSRNLGVRRRLARAAIDGSAAELLYFRAMWTSAEGKPNHAYGPASKMFSSEVFRRDSADLLDLTAPESIAFASSDAAFINLCYRHAQVTTVYAGTSEVHRSMIAERQLGLPRTR